jgi:deoxyadenosine/deoxycytidine kinase
MNKKLVIIGGNLGVGKTTLANKLGQHLDWHVGYESVSDNPYLVDFYNDMQKWSYHLQVYFLGHRAEQHLISYNNHKHSILDRSIYEDGYIFATYLYHSGRISERDYNSYMALFRYVISTLPTPHLLIYVKASIVTILKRIKHRAQQFDKGLSSEYLQMINNYYEKWINNFALCPIITIDSEEYDLLNNENDLLSIIQQIKFKLGQ